MGYTKKSKIFLRPSNFCDCENPYIVEAAKKMAENVKSERERAVKIFYFVRDEVKFAYPGLGKASDTLRRGYGICSSKANLQVALLRSLGIPARFRLQQTNGQFLFADKIPPFFEKQFFVEVTHVAAEAQLNGKWIVADATFDKELDPKRARDWHGKTDAMILNKGEIFEESTVKDIDHILRDRQEKLEKMSKQELALYRINIGIINTYFELARIRNRLESKPGERAV